MLLLCALVAGSSSVWATELEIALNNLYQGSTKVTAKTVISTSGESLTFNDEDGLFTIKITRNSGNQPGFYTSSGYLRFYNTDVVEVESVGGDLISSIAITKNGSTAVAVTVSPGTLNSESWSGSASKVTFTGTGTNKWDKLTINYAPASTDPAISLSANSLEFGQVEATGSKKMTFTVTPSNLTAGLTLSTNNAKYTVSPTSIAATATGAQTITVTASPTSVNDNMTGKVIISGDDFTDDTEVSLTTTVIRKDAGIYFDPTSVELTQGETFTAPTFNNPNSLTGVVFTSTYDAVATVSDAGAITLGNSTGTAVIKATFAQTDVYNAGEATCTITVNPAGVTPEPSAGGYYEKVTSTEDLEDGDYLIVYETGEVALDGNLSSNNVDASNNTISVTFDSDDNIEVTSETEAAEFEIKAMTGGHSIKSKSQSYYLTHTGSSNTLNTSSSAVANDISFSGGNAAIKVGNYNIRYNSASGQERFRYYTTTANVQLYKKVASQSPSSIDVYVSAAGFATYASNFDLDYAGSGLVAYKAVEDNGDIKFEEVTKVPAGAGVLLRASDGGGQNYAVSTTTSSETEDMTDNKFVRGTGAAVASNDGAGNYNYILNVVNNEIGFYRAAGNTVATNRAYIHTTVNPSSGAIQFNFDEATGIHSIDNGQLTMDNKIYNLNGQRVAQPTKGLYIVNGKKVIMK